MKGNLKSLPSARAIRGSIKREVDVETKLEVNSLTWGSQGAPAGYSGRVSKGPDLEPSPASLCSTPRLFVSLGKLGHCSAPVG